MKIWQLVRNAQQAQSNIIKRLQHINKQQLSQQLQEQNQFINTKIIKQISCTSFKSFAPEQVQYKEQVICPVDKFHNQTFVQSQEQNDKDMKEQSISFVINGRQISIKFKENQQEKLFPELIQKAQREIGRKISERGLQKILKDLQLKITQIKQLKQEKPFNKSEISTVKNSLISQATTIATKNNKQNCFKIRAGNYQSINKVKKNSVSINYDLPTRGFGKRNKII